MTMLSETPPSAPEPPNSKSIQRKMIYGVGLAVALLIVALLATTKRKRIADDVPEVASNLRQIGIALYEFQQEYGAFPDGKTQNLVKAKNPGSDVYPNTSNSNGYFRQLIVAGITQDEGMFYARIPGSRKPDGQISGSKAIDKGECGFTYLLGATKDCHPMRPLAITPMIPGTDRFDPKPFKGKVYASRADNSVMSFPIDKQGHALMEGKNLMDPTHPVWEGKPPSIAWPDL